jgi:acetolactate synthase-1/2/3 large subunit
MMRVADYIMHRLLIEGITHVFQVTGRGSLFLSDALAKNEYLKSVSLHHEQSCAFAAIGYAESSGKLGAALVSTGCASTNTITGVLSAWQDGVPCIFISGQNVLNETTNFTKIGLRTYGQQEADIVKLVSPITKYAHMLTRPKDIVKIMDEAIYQATNGRKGPVWIDVPIDLQSSLIEPENLETSSLDGFYSCTELDFESKIDEVVSLLNISKRPVVLIGKGVRSAGAEIEFFKFVDKIGIPVVYAASATDVFCSGSNLNSIGSVGAMGCSRSGSFAVANSDLLIVLGSRLSSLTTGPDYCDFARDAKIIVVDIDPLEHSKESVRKDLFVNSDLKVFLSKIIIKEINKIPFDWLEKCLHWKIEFGILEDSFNSTDNIDLYQLSEVLGMTLPTNSTLVVDSGLAEVILPTNIRFKNGMRCVHPTSQGVMGFALPAAIGVACATDSPVLVVVGDGSIMMNLQELESIRYNKLPIKIIVVNNNIYSIIRKRQKDLFRSRTIGTSKEDGVSVPEFIKVADCFGLDYMLINHVSKLEQELNVLFTMNGPVICEVIGLDDQAYIEIGTIRSIETGKIVRRPIEDQKPFLSRELFLSEMIVKPIKQ